MALGRARARAGQDAARDSGYFISGIGGHIDSDGTRSRFRNSNHIRNIRCGEPVRMLCTHLVEKRKGGQTTADGKQTGLKNQSYRS